MQQVEQTKEQWFDELVDRCKQHLDTLEKDTLVTYWYVGDELVKEGYNPREDQWRGRKTKGVISLLAKKIGRSTRTVRYSYKLRITYQDLGSVASKVTSWHEWSHPHQNVEESEFDGFRLATPYGTNIYRISTKFQTSRKDGWYVIKDDDPFPTLKRRSWFFHEDGREYSLREYARVQEFPDSFSFIGGVEQIKDQIGNAVPPPMAKYVAQKVPPSNAIDLFAGAGGMTLGFRQAGHKILLMVEWDKTSCYTYHHNLPNVKVLQKDIGKVQIEQILSQLDGQNVNLVFGGPPCQGFSISGLKFKDDPRNSLYKEFLRIVDGLQPNFLVMENVLGVLGFKDQILEDIHAIGYNASFEVVKGEDLGMRQHRHRVFFYGSRDA